MGLFSRKERSRATVTPGSHKNSSSAEIKSTSSSSSLKSPGPTTPSFGKMPPMMAMIPKVALPKAPDPHVDPVGYLRDIRAVRERNKVVLEKAKRNQLNHFEVDMSKFENTTKFVVSIIKRDFAPDYANIPPHGRWQHFNVGGRDRIGALLSSWPSSVDPSERCRRLLDLFLVSVLLDAGAGTTWTYKSKENGRLYRRSEGLAVASLEMFIGGLFSSNLSQPCQVDGQALGKLTVDKLAFGLQITKSNALAGLEGRAKLLIRLGDALNNQMIFGADARPGNMLDYLISHPTTSASSVPIVALPTLWSVLMDGLGPIWPASRTSFDGTSLGDAWPLTLLETVDPPLASWETIVPFHKLSQWLCYSVMQPMSKLMNIHFAGADLMTGLPEYRNGGLFIDMGVLILKQCDEKRGLEIYAQHHEREGKNAMEVTPMFNPEDDVIVEWRAVTVGFLDVLLEDVNALLGLEMRERLTLPQMLEAGSWKGGREMAEISRPNTQCPPIGIISDGTIF